MTRYILLAQEKGHVILLFAAKYNNIVVIPPNTSHAVIYSWLSACSGEMKPLNTAKQASTHGYLASLRNKPQHK